MFASRTMHSALGVALAKDPAALSADDALTIACACAPVAVQWSASDGQDGTRHAACDLNTMEVSNNHP